MTTYDDWKLTASDDDEWPPPPRINARRGATNENIETTRECVDLLGLKFLHIVEAAADAYRLATVRVIENHNENTYGPKTRPASFEYGLADIMEGLAANLHSLTSDLTGDIADAPEES